LLFLLFALLAVDALAELRVHTGELPVSATLIQKRLAGLENADLDDVISKRAASFYRHALAYIEAARADRATAEQFALAAEKARAEAERIRRDTDARIAGSSAVRTLVPDNASAREIELRYEQEKANEAAVKAKLEEIERSLKAESMRPGEARRRLAAASQESARLAQERFAPPARDESSMREGARRWLLRTHAEALSAEIAKFDQALISQPMRLDLLAAQR
jgi:potassium efflux system protein